MLINIKMVIIINTRVFVCKLVIEQYNEVHIIDDSSRTHLDKELGLTSISKSHNYRNLCTLLYE